MNPPSAPPRLPHVPLAAKILLWFTLNCVILAGLFAVLVLGAYGLPFDALLFGSARERLRPVRQLVEGELRDRPRSEWDEVLARFHEAYQVEFYVFDHGPDQIAGPPVALPEAVRSRLLARPGFLRRAPNGNRPGDGAPRAENAENPPSQDRRRPRFLLRTSHPARYWVFENMVLPRLQDDASSGSSTDPTVRDGSRPTRPQPPRQRRRAQPLMLVIESPSVTGNGLWLDPKPLLFFALGGIGLSLIFWFPLLRGVSRSIAQLAQASRRIAEGRFDIRVADRRADELGDLARDVNAMAKRLEGLVAGQRRFLGDIAHELCSPVSRLQLSLGILEQHAPCNDARYVSSAQENARDIADLVNELLSFSKGALGEDAAPMETVSLPDLVAEVVARELPDEITVQVAVQDNLRVQAQPRLLARAVGNLIRNALQHGGGTEIRISASETPDGILIVVEDRGPGVPDAELDTIFDPFYRLDTSRNADTGGVGLGLSIVRACMESCGGNVRAEHNTPRGLRITLTLPHDGRPPS